MRVTVPESRAVTRPWLRWWQRLGLLGVAAVALVLVVVTHRAPAHPWVSTPRMKAVMFSQAGTALLHHATLLDEVLQGVSQAGYNQVCIGVYGQSGPFWRTRLHPRDPWYLPFSTTPFTTALNEARRQGLAVHAWFEYGLMLPPASPIARQHPDWLLRTPAGHTLVQRTLWLDPAHPGVQTYMLGLVRELAGHQGLAGILLDDHQCVPVEFGDHRAAVTALTRRIRAEVKAVNPRLTLGLTPNGYRYALERYNQDWMAWVREGLVDEVTLQAYRSTDAELVEAIETSGLDEAARHVPVGVAVYAGESLRPFTEAAVGHQIGVVERKGYGHLVFVWEHILARRWLGRWPF
jgi:uncharacterized lipoprotein YddW (UPF0748 family)